MKKLNELLSLHILQDAEVIAGKNGLNRLVESVETLDTPDMMKFVSNNSLLLTTGFSFKDNPEELCNLITKLDASTCVGIGIKVNRFIHEIPVEVIDKANSLDFPIINIPNSVTLTEVAHHLLKFLWKNKTDELFHAFKIQKKLSNLMLKGASLQTIIDHLDVLMDCPVLLFNPFANSFTCSKKFRPEQIENIQQKVTPFIHDRTINNDKESLSQDLHIDNELFSLTIFPVETTHPYPHWLALLNSSSEVPLTVIEQASNIISSMIVKNEAIMENERVVKNNFFNSLVDGNIQSQQEIIHRGKHYGLKTDQKYVCLVCKLDEGKQLTIFEKEKEMNKLSHMISEVFVSTFTNQNIEQINFIKNDYFIIILQFPKEFNKTLKQMIIDNIKAFQNQMNDDFQTSISFGISNFVNEVVELPVIYREAVDALITGTSSNQKQAVRFYRAKQLKELLRMIPNDNLRDFYKETLRSLAFPKTNEENDLLNTLSVYLDHNCEITETAKVLFVHRNTVKYRIAKCEKILQYNIHDPDNSLRLRTSLLVRNLFTN